MVGHKNESFDDEERRKCQVSTLEDHVVTCSNCRKTIGNNAHDQCVCKFEAAKEEFYVKSCGIENCVTYYTNQRYFGCCIYSCYCDQENKSWYKNEKLYPDSVTEHDVLLKYEFKPVNIRTENLSKDKKLKQNYVYSDEFRQECQNFPIPMSLISDNSIQANTERSYIEISTDSDISHESLNNKIKTNKRQQFSNIKLKEKVIDQMSDNESNFSLSPKCMGMGHMQKVTVKPKMVYFKIQGEKEHKSRNIRKMRKLKEESRLVSLRSKKYREGMVARVSNKELLTELVNAYFKEYHCKGSNKSNYDFDLDCTLRDEEFHLRYPLSIYPGQQMDMSSYFNRLWSFSTWPKDATVSAIRLAAAGFFYTLVGYTVKCFSCKVTVSDWSADNVPLKVHEQLSPLCEFIRMKKEDEENTITPLENESFNFLEQASLPVSLLNSSTETTQAMVDEITGKFNASVQVSSTEDREQNDIDHDSSFPYVSNSRNANNFQIASIGGHPIQQPFEIASPSVDNTTIYAPPSISRFQQMPSDLPFGHHDHSQPYIEEQVAIDIPPDVDISDEQQLLGDAKHPQYINFRNRLQSYVSWSYHNIQLPQRLVEAGFYHVGSLDIVRCFYCDIGLAEWDVEDDPWVEHARHSPQCLFLREKKGHIFIESIQESWRQIYSPKHPQYEDFHARLNTFQNWPSDADQTPHQLTTAGFYYIGEDDTVRCHYCDGGLRQWERGDDPWVEHARWFPYCKYVVKIKGIAYIEQIARTYNEIYANPSQVPREVSEPSLNGNEQAQALGYQTPTGSNRNALTTPAAVSVLQMGYSQSTLKMAINEYIRTKDSREFTPQSLVNIILDKKEHELPKDDDETENATNSRSIMQKGLQDVRKINPEELNNEQLRLVNKRIKDNVFLCKHCKQRERRMIFLPCGHRDACETCAKEFMICYTCGDFIDSRVKTFLS